MKGTGTRITVGDGDGFKGRTGILLGTQSWKMLKAKNTSAQNNGGESQRIREVTGSSIGIYRKW